MSVVKPNSLCIRDYKENHMQNWGCVQYFNISTTVYAYTEFDTHK